MSRYRGSGNFGYADPAPPTRWDADRFARERDYREVDEYYQPAPPPPRRASRPVYEEERYYYEDDRYGPRGQQIDRRYFEEDEYYDPRQYRGQMVPFRPARQPPRPEAPPRPGLLRRQSSLDTFDRPPNRRYEDYEGYRPPQRPPRINIDVPEEPSPRSNRYRPSRQSRQSRDYYDYDYRDYDDVAIQDPDYYGDDGFREYREREWVRHRTRDESGSRSRSRSRSRPATEAQAEEVKEEKKETIRKESIKEEFKEEVKSSSKEKPYPRRGKTKMPKRLVHTKVLFDLGYPFYEEGEKTIIIEKALGPDNIDEVFTKSREYREQEVSTTLLIEAPPAPSQASHAPSSRAPPASVKSSNVRASTARGPSISAPSVRESFKEDVFKETEVKTIPLSEAPRSVREWDQLTVKDDEKSVRSSDRRKSVRSKSRPRSEVDDEVIIEKKSTVIEREPSRSPSPSPERRRRRHRSKSRRREDRSSFDETEIIERKIITEEDVYPYESDAVHVGPLALAMGSGRRRSDREIKDDIRRLEAEQRALRREREFESDFVTIDRRDRRDENDIVMIDRRDRRGDNEVVRIERRGPERSPSPPITGGEILIERRGDEVVEIRKDRRERSPTRVRAPSAGLIKSMFYTLT